VDAYIGPSGVLTGAARVAQTAREKADALASQQEATRHQRELENKRAALERQIAQLRSEHESDEVELRRVNAQLGTRMRLVTAERTELGRLRQADALVAAGARGQPKTQRRDGRPGPKPRRSTEIGKS
jgi:circadian clock protein KaiC